MKRLWPACFAALMVLALPAPAAALEELGTANVARNHLSVSGPDVFYARWLRREEGFDVIRARAAGSRRFPGLAESSDEDLGYINTEFDASSERYAFSFIATDDSDAEMSDREGWMTARPFEAPVTGPGCVGGFPVLAVSGDAVAIRPTDCAVGGDVTVYDFAPGAPVPQRTVDLPDDDGAVRLAGRYLAYATGARGASATSPNRQVVVYDWVAGAEAYRIGASEQIPLPGTFRFDRFDLQSDGKLVAASARTAEEEEDDAAPPCADRLNVVWWSVAEPQPHVLPVKACNTRVKIGNDRLAFFRGSGAAGAELVTSDLAGGSITPVMSVAHEGMIHAFDFDGARAAFAVRGCHNPSVFAEVPQPAKRTAFPRPNCPARISRSAGRITRRGEALVKVTCPVGCRDLDVEVRKPFRSLLDARIGVDRSHTFRFPVPASIRAKLARGRRVLMTVRASHSTFDAGSSYQVFPRQRIFERTVTLLPR